MMPFASSCHIEAQPARMHENFDGLAMEALSKEWPCPLADNAFKAI